MGRRSSFTVLASIAVVFAVIQLFGPTPSNPPVDPARTLQSQTAVPPSVQAVLDRSCVDCHGHSTQWPWYSNVAPVRWLVVGHVDEARSHLDFDTWADYRDYDKQHLLEELCEEVEKGEMPLPSYLRLHSDARLSDEDRAALCAWAKTERTRILAQMGETLESVESGNGH